MHRIPEIRPNTDYNEVTKKFLDAGSLDLDEERKGAELIKTVINGPVKSILEIGCGLGFVSSEISRQLKGRDVKITATDLEPTTVEHAKDVSQEALANGNLSFEVLDIYSPPERKFDMIFCMEVLHHLDYLESAFRNIYGMLNDPGFFIFHDLNRNGLRMARSDIKWYQKERKNLYRELDKNGVVRFLGREWDRLDLLSRDSRLAAYTPNEVERALKHTGFGQFAVCDYGDDLCGIATRDSKERYLAIKEYGKFGLANNPNR